MMQPEQDLSKLAKAVDLGIDVDELLKSILFEWADPEGGVSGTDGLAKALKDCFEAATGGSQTQARILHDIMQLIHARTSVASLGSDDIDEEEAEFQEALNAARDG